MLTNRKHPRFLLIGCIALALSARAGAAFDITTNLSGDNTGYGKSITGAVDDSLFYSIGGGNLVSGPPGRQNLQRIGIGGGWSSDLMCGNFDLKTTVSNQLNGVTRGFQDMMGNVIQSATGAVASLPAMVIQRANPGLYELLTNGLLQANVAFDKGMLNCQSMSKKLADYTLGGSLKESAKAEQYKQIARNGGDVIAANQQADKDANGNEGKVWVGGSKRGGAGQQAIKPAFDVAKAGFNMINNQPVESTGAVSNKDCAGAICKQYKTSEEAAKAVVEIVGDRSLRTCASDADCQSGGLENEPGSASPGTGFTPMLEKKSKENLETLAQLVNGQLKVTPDNLAKLHSGDLMVSRGIIEALKDDPDNAAIVQRLAGELAMADTISTALGFRRMMVAGQTESHIASTPEVLEESDRRVDFIDKEVQALNTEMQLRREISNNSLLVALERQRAREENHRLQQKGSSGDKAFGGLSKPEESK